MEQARLAPLVGIVGCLGTVAALVYPYLAADGSVATYYGSGVVNPLVAGLLAAVTVIVFAAGREDRTDPDFSAGAGLVFGAFATVIVLLWALTVRVDALEITNLHRWVAVVVAATVPAAGAWYARTLDVV